MQKAHVYFSPIEEEYRKKYGMYPDYHYFKLCEIYDKDIAGYIRQQNIDKIYEEMKEKDKRAKEKEEYMLTLECPF